MKKRLALVTENDSILSRIIEKEICGQKRVVRNVPERIESSLILQNGREGEASSGGGRGVIIPASRTL